ncbi:hydrolase Nlp/P60 [Actinosynnema sp. CS-041913]|uniref:hydrolase Nlp/P60 n=1 Tax=Actinosynnema sp. CS-041913 TaxID=3239917 RepID=UPI003D8F6935
MDALFGSSSSTFVDCTRPIADIPPDYCLLYITAAPDCLGLGWTVLAAIGKVEPDHGRLKAPGVTDSENLAGAGGPMQFLATTFTGVITAHRIPPGGTHPPSRYNTRDAVHAAAFLLCDEGARRGDLRAAIYAYNPADWYVDKALEQARKYAEAAATSVGHGDCNTIQAHNTVTLAAINYPRGMHGTPGNIHHVGLYIGAGLMINAPNFDQPVQIDNHRYPSDDYAGATRPTTPIAL